MISIKNSFLVILFLSLLFVSCGIAQNNVQEELDSAKFLLIEGKFQESSKILHRLINNDPENVTVFYYLGLAYQSMLNYQLASAVLEKAIKLDPENIKLMSLLGSNYFSAGRITDADSILSKARLLDSTDTQILLLLGQIYKKEHNWNNALLIYLNLMKGDSTNSFYYEQLGYCNLALNAEEEAIINYQIAHKLNPFNQNTVLELSQLYFQQEKFISAMRIIDDGLKIYPLSKIMLTKKGDINLKLKNYNDAISSYLKSIFLGDSSATNYRNIGICYFWNTKYDSAIIYLSRASEIMDKDASAYFYLGISYKYLKQYDKAIININNAINLQRSDFLAEAFIQLAATYYEQKDYPNALKYYQNALLEKPDKKEIFFYLAAVYDNYYKDKTIAINNYKKFLSDAEDKTDESLLKYAKNRINVLTEENHFRKAE